MNFTILRHETIDSTNTEALNQARKGAPEGLCVIARQQTAGRGRHGRIWISGKDAGLYFSIVLRPRAETRFLPLLTLLAAVAVCDALSETYGLPCDIKWPNDVHVRGKKICGILAETCETVAGLAVVVGVGINLSSSNFPPEFNYSATSIEAETGRAAADAGEPLLEALTIHFGRYYDTFRAALARGGAAAAEGAEMIRREWVGRSSYAFGKAVRVRMENETITGTTRGIEENGALRLETETGEIKIIQAGEVEKLRQL